MIPGLIAVGAVVVAACFERNYQAPCPPNAPIDVSGECYMTPPDGYVVPPDMVTVTCTSSATCPVSSPTCGPAQQCVGCSPMGQSTDCATYHGGTNPPTPLCGPNGSCVECLTNDQCDAVHLSCQNNACGACRYNTDCTSGLCNAATGKCADKINLLYVNDAPAAGCSDAGNGAFATPFCTVQKGLNASNAVGRQVIIFPGKGGYVEALTANANAAYTANAVGVGGPVIKPSGTFVALSVAGSATSGMTVAVTLDGLIFDGSSQSGGADLIDCTGGAAYGQAVITLLRSTIRASSGIGLSAMSKCTITMDADMVRDNKAGGLSFAGSDFALTNLFVLANGTPTTASPGSNFGGIYVSSAGESGKMNIANVTVLGNKADNNASASAMICPVASVKTINTMVFGNLGPSTEIHAACIGIVATPQMTFSAFAGGSSMLNDYDIGGCSLSTLFADPNNADPCKAYAPKKGNGPPCNLVNQGTNVGAPDHDYCGTARPQPPVGGKWDIGAVQAL